MSYLFSWTAVVLLKPGSAAIIALVGGEYITKLLYHATASSNALASLPAIIIPDWPHKLVGVLAVLIVSLINLLSTRSGTGVQVVLTVVKIGSILLVIVLGLVGFAKGGGGVLSANGLFEGSSRQIGSYAIALYSGLWAFDGCEWDFAFRPRSSVLTSADNRPPFSIWFSLGPFDRAFIETAFFPRGPVELCCRRDAKCHS